MTNTRIVNGAPPWMEPLSESTREAVRRNVADAPELTDRQHDRLRLLFRIQAGAAK